MRLTVCVFTMIATVCIGAQSASAGAETMAFEPEAVTVIAAPSGGVRVLLKLPDLTALVGTEIINAKVTFESPQSDESTTTFELRAISTNWSAGSATWAAPWTVPGGDVVANCSSRSTLFPSSHSAGSVVIDATVMFQRFAEPGVAIFGLLLRPLANEGSGYGAAIASALDSPTAFTIQVRFETTE